MGEWENIRIRHDICGIVYLINKQVPFMKAKLCLIIILILTAIPGFSQVQTERVNEIVKEPGRKKQTELLVDSREFIFHARMAMPSGSGAIDLTSHHSFVRFSPEMIESDMPFFGRAYSGAGYGDTGLHFEGKPDEFTIKKQKNNYQITARVKGETDFFRIHLSVTLKGYANLSISSNNRETMSFSGEIREDEERGE